jgi:hypothetical protein
VPDDEEEMTWLLGHFHPDIPVICEACCHLGPFATFDGDIPARIREARVMSRVRDLLTQELPFDGND